MSDGTLMKHIKTLGGPLNAEVEKYVGSSFGAYLH